MENLYILQKNYLTAITKSLTNFKKSPKARLTANYIKIRIETLEQHWEAFNNNHEEIIKIATVEQGKNHEYFKDDFYSKCEEEYIDAKSEMADAFDKVQPQTSVKYSQNLGCNQQGNQEVKLPKINIPVFSGNYNDWNTFHGLYSSMIHDNEALSNIQKLHYLKTCVTGEPEQLLKHIQISHQNYEVAWETLKLRYNNKRVIVNTILNRLLKQKKLSQESAQGIKVLLDTTTECLNNLKNNNINIENWDPIIIHLLVTKLDQNTHKEWEAELKDLPVEDLPTWKKFHDFLEGKFRVLEMIQSAYTNERPSVRTRAFLTSAPDNRETQKVCAYCSSDHRIYKCTQFLELSPTMRSEFVKRENLCYNCLWPGHSVKFCRHKTSCFKCKRKHHTLLHEIRQKNIESNDTRDKEIHEDSTRPSNQIMSHVSTHSNNTILATALVNINTNRGMQIVRALIDPCSQESFICEATAQRLQLRKDEVEGQVTGVGKMSTPIQHAVQLEISSRLDQSFKVRCTAFVIKQVTEIMPANKINSHQWVQFTGLTLADPTFNVPGHIDLLLGVNIYTQILMHGIIKGNANLQGPIAQQTHFGWIISGRVPDQENNTRGIVSMHLNVTLDHMLQRFWEEESLETDRPTITELEKRTEEIYERTFDRQADGRYIVSLPFKSDSPILPEDSRTIALRRFKSLEKRLENNKSLGEEYNRVIKEYLDLKHMEPITAAEIENKGVYLPHHAVVREDKETTKLRVVFDASCLGSNGISLNDELLVGPRLQEELRDLIMRWRAGKICFVADIVKMYRQIKVRKQDTDCQRILYRFSPEDEVQDYRLLTVTFGTASAPYLAIRTLKQLAKDESDKYPLAAKILVSDFYMDDVLSGFDDVETAIKAQKELTELLGKGGFELQKWSSNNQNFLQTVEPKHRAQVNVIDMNRKETIKTLGIIWETKEDNLKIAQKNNLYSTRKDLTKRNVLSQIASLFDPMGWLAPSIITAKVLMQTMWLRKIEWDEDLPDDLKDEWIVFQNDLPQLSNIKIPRWTGCIRNDIKELHGFSDASIKAYSAVVYLRVLNPDGTPKNVSLVIAKTKVAPLKSLTLPRLELCAATLLSKLLKHVMRILDIDLAKTYAWTDSKIVLAWIKGNPNRWTTFVKNRVIEIRNNLDSYWSYINTKENPADPASRGILPSKLKTCNLWWDGPSFLHQIGLSLPSESIPATDLEQRLTSIKCANTNVVLDKTEFILTILKKYSSLNKLLNVVAYCRRWRTLKNKDNLPQHITCKEKEEALTLCLKMSQQLEFPDELMNLKKNNVVKKSSRLLPLNPYIDQDEVIRVGGRLKHADIEFNMKHPIILTKDNVLLPLLLHEAHLQTLHGGPQLMTAYLKSRYWIIKGGQSIKRYYKQCKLCTRYNAKVSTQIMGDLPDIRVRPSRPFLISGVDFAGPIPCRMSKGRGAKTYKTYICLFICMATKAIHLELVSDMTTDAFIASLKRFVSRRGHCQELWSDHGTTFIASEKALLQMWKQGQNELPDDLKQILDKRGTRWRYIPPGAPNFGGLWEAGVKSTKYHLKRILRNSTLTFEELYTVLTQIEACLNSRPLTALGENLDFITPGHFLVGEPIVTIPDSSCDLSAISSLSRWQLTQKMLRDFWRHWQSEYLSRLQQRPKWQSAQKDIEIDQLVLLKDSRLPPGEWQLGRIIKKYPGSDGHTRMYDVYTNTGVKQRAISKLCRLPE